MRKLWDISQRVKILCQKVGLSRGRESILSRDSDKIE